MVKLLKFGIRDILWLTALAAVLSGWFVHQRFLQSQVQDTREQAQRRIQKLEIEMAGMALEIDFLKNPGLPASHIDPFAAPRSADETCPSE
jgi:hypothetical protein